MKKYAPKWDHWKITKTLEFLGNFLKNHQGTIQDEDIFSPITDLCENCDWEEKIKAIFPAPTVTRMENLRNRYNQLDFSASNQEIFRAVWNFSGTRQRFAKMLTAEIESLLKQHPQEQYSDEIFPRQLKELQKTLVLSDFETNVMLVLALISNGMLTIIGGHSRCTDENDKAIFIAKCLDCDMQTVMSALNCKAKLRRYNCVTDDLDFNRRLFELLNRMTCEPLKNTYFKLYQDEVFPWEFYGDLVHKHGKIILDLLKSPGGSVNILFYGEPDTGKTSFARTLARKLDKKCFQIAQDTNESDHPICTRKFRFAALQICDKQIDPANSLIIVDDADEMLREDSSFSQADFIESMNTASGDKGVFNDVLDNIKTPTIWITNSPPETLNESNLCRFDYSISFAPLNASQRKSMWINNIKKLQITSLIDEPTASFFAERYNVNAGIITKVLSNVKRLVLEQTEVRNTVEKLMAQHYKLLDIPMDENRFPPTSDYSLDGLNIKGDLELKKIVAAVRKYQTEPASNSPDRPRMNLLLSGPPGTGKTEFVKHLGNVLNTPIAVKMGSDLLSMYVGGTEHNIKNAFATAEAEHAILFLDETDGLVQSRRRANRHWEITQVNELLHQMENFNGIMIGATNFVQTLDLAIMRRFTFKLNFDYLDNLGKVIFFERIFNTHLSTIERRRLEAIEKLTPGDFRTVRQSLYYLNEVSNTARLSALEQESHTKKNNIFNYEERKIGF